MMDQATEQKLEEFISICSYHDFSEEEQQLSLAVNLLKAIYTTNFRHEYSKISRMLSHPKNGIYTPDQLSCLRGNLSLIESQAQQMGLTEQQMESFQKLADHIRLEAYRIENVDMRLAAIEENFERQQIIVDVLANDNQEMYRLRTAAQSALESAGEAVRMQQKLERSLKQTNDQMSSIQEVEQTLSKQYEDIKGKLNSFDTHSVTILSIFSAIVFAFTGGFTMLGSAFSNLAGITRNESILLITLVLVVGCILVDIIYFLLHFIGRVTGIPVGGGCTLQCSECNVKGKDKPTCNFLQRLTHRHPIVFWSNIGILLVVILLFVSNLFWITPAFPAGASVHVPAGMSASAQGLSSTLTMDTPQLAVTATDVDLPTE